MKPSATIYVITNLANGKAYIGLTRFDLTKRWREHRYSATSGRRTRLYSAMRKYGYDNFSIMPIVSCLSVDCASEIEQEVIQSLRPQYNQTNGGEFTAGKRMPRSVVERIAAKNKGLKRTPEHNKKMSEIKKQQFADNPELKARATAQLLSAMSLINKDKQRAAASAASHNRIWSEESRAKLSASCMGRRYSKEIIERMAAKKRKPVLCLTLNKSFGSILEAAEVTGTYYSSVSKVCRGKRKTTRGLSFCFV